MFIALDKDSSGSLSKQELREYADGTLTEIIIERGMPRKFESIVCAVYIHLLKNAKKSVWNSISEDAPHLICYHTFCIYLFRLVYSCFAFDMPSTVFDEHVRRGKSGGSSREMDFDSFLDFVLALENKDTPEGLTYLFRCLDLQGRGYLTTADIHSLFR